MCELWSSGQAHFRTAKEPNKYRRNPNQPLLSGTFRVEHLSVAPIWCPHDGRSFPDVPAVKNSSNAWTPFVPISRAFVNPTCIDLDEHLAAFEGKIPGSMDTHKVPIAYHTPNRPTSPESKKGQQQARETIPQQLHHSDSLVVASTREFSFNYSRHRNRMRRFWGNSPALDLLGDEPQVRGSIDFQPLFLAVPLQRS